MKIKVNDKVMVIAGKDKGHVGIVKATDDETNRVIVEGAGMKTYTTKPTQDHPEGLLEKKEGPINASNVMFFAESGKKDEPDTVSKISITRERDVKTGRNKVVRVLKRTGKEI